MPSSPSSHALGVAGAVLGSGSKANAYYFSWNGLNILVDNGFSYRELGRRLGQAGVSLDDLDYLFVTHSHTDHIRGVGPLLRRHNLRAFMSQETADAIGAEASAFRQVQGNREYSLADGQFRTFPLSHDAPGALGFSFQFGESRYTIITDTGTVSDAMRQEAAMADVLFLESNYCPLLLEKGPYPPVLKKRIASSTGHLSNLAAAEFLNSIYSFDYPKKVYLCHLSENNNIVERVEEVMRKELEYEIDYTVCPRNTFVPLDTEG